MTQCSHCGGGGVVGSSLPCPSCSGTGTPTPPAGPVTPGARDRADLPPSPTQPTTAGPAPTRRPAPSAPRTRTPAQAGGTPTTGASFAGTPTPAAVPASTPPTAPADAATPPAGAPTTPPADGGGPDAPGGGHPDASRNLSEAGNVASIYGVLDPTGTVSTAGTLAQAASSAGDYQSQHGTPHLPGHTNSPAAPGGVGPAVGGAGGGGAGRRERMRNKASGAPGPRTAGQPRRGSTQGSGNRARDAAANLNQKLRHGGQRATATVKRAGIAGVAVFAVFAMLLGGGGFLITSTGSPRTAQLASPKPTAEQCTAVGGAAWCEVFWGAEQSTWSTGGEPVTYALLAAIAHYTTDNGRRSPEDSVDRTPTAGVGSDTLARSAHVPVTTIGTAAATAMSTSMSNHRMTLDITRAPTVDGATTADMIADLWDDNNSPTFLVRSNLVVFAGDADTDPAAFGAAVRDLLAKTPGSTVYWTTLPGKPELNAALSEVAGAEPRLKLVDVAAAAAGNARLADAGAVDGLSPAGRMRAAQMVTDAVAKNATAPTTTSPGANGVAPAVRNAAVAVPFATGAGLDGCPVSTGVTYNAAPGTAVHAIVGGKVADVATVGAHGTAVTVVTGNHYARYSHLSAVAVVKGQTVTAGQQVGAAGATGAPTSPGVLVEWMRATTGPGQTDCAAYEDPAGAAAAPGGPSPSPSPTASTPAGTPSPTPSNPSASPGATTSPSPSPSPTSASPTASTPGTDSGLPDHPSWIGRVANLNKPGNEADCPVPTIEPAITGPGGSAGPFLLNGDEAAKMRAEGQDPNNPCQSAVWLARALAHSDAVKQAASANPDRFIGRDQYAAFWKEAIAATDLVVNPKADGTNCTAFPADSTVAEKITYALACRSQNKDPHTVTGFDGAKPVAVDGNASLATLQAEAVRVAGVFSEWGAKPCDANADVAGVLPLTAAQMESVDLGGGRKGDRCNPDDNIAAAAELLLTGESVPVAARGTAKGPYTALLGGWEQFTWVAARGTSAALTYGPTVWRPDATCTTTISTWAADPASTLDNAPATVGGCNAPTASDFYDAARPVVARAAAAVPSAATLLAALPAAGPPANPAPVLERFSRGADIAALPASDQGKVRASLATPGGMAELADKVAEFTVAAGGWPEKGIWIPAFCAPGSAALTTGPAINLPAGDAATNAASIFKAFVAAGTTEAGAAGILGNIQEESGFDPNIFQGQGPFGQKNPRPVVRVSPANGGFGLVQWTSYNRQEAMLAYVDTTGRPWDDIGVQVGFIVKEMKDSYPGAWTAVSTLNDPVKAAYEFHRIYEGSADTEAMIAERTSAATAWLAKLKGSAGTPAAIPAAGPAPATPTAGTSDRTMPIAAGTPITSPYGMRNLNGSTAMHDGIDYGAPEGTPVYAAHEGAVKNRRDDPTGYGLYVQITSVDGKTVTDYGHLSAMDVVPDGTVVKPGTMIGKVGNTGQSFGAHLHFRVHVDGASVNPEEWLSGAGTPTPTAVGVGGTCVRAGATTASFDTTAIAATCPTTAPAGTIVVPGNVADLCRAAVGAAASPQAAKAIVWGFNQLGSAYSQGNRMGERVFDCSSLVGRSYATGAGVTEFFSPWPPATPAYADGQRPAWITEVPKDQAKAGDIIIMWGAGDTLANSAGNFGHAQIYLGNDLILQSGGSPNVVNVASYQSETLLSGWQHKIFRVTPPAGVPA